MSKRNSNIISAANAFTLGIDDGAQVPGIICAANESRFNQSTFSEPLTAYSVGWKDPDNLQAILDAIAGQPIPVARRFEFKKAVNSEAFLSDSDDDRSIGGEFKRVEYRGETVNAKLANRGLTIRIDKDEIDENDSMWQERTVGLLQSRLLRNSIIRAVSGLQTAGNASSAVWTYNADTNANPNPDGNLRSALMTAAGKSGIRPNRILMGESAWDLRVTAYEMQNTAGAFAAANVTPNELAARLFVDLVTVARSRYTAGSARTLAVGDKAIAYTALNGASKDDPSNIKRFVRTGGMKVYVEEKNKYVDITVEHYELLAITSTLGIEVLSLT